MPIKSLYIFVFTGASLIMMYLIFPSDLQMGIDCKKSKNYDEAIIYLQQALTKNPSSGHVMNLLAQTYHLQGNNEAYAAVLETLSTRYPKKILFQRQLVEVYENNQDIPNLIRAHTMLSKNMPRDSATLMKQKDLLLVQRNYKQAAEVLERFIAIHPKNMNALQECAYLYALCRDFKAAQKLYTKILSHNIKNESMWLLLIDLAFADRDIKRAEIIIKNYLSQHWVTLAQYRHVQSRYSTYSMTDAEIELVRNAAHRFPDKPYLLKELSQLYAWNKRQKQAIHTLEQYLKIVQNDDSSRIFLAKLYSWTQNKTGELAELEKLQQLRPKDTSLIRQIAELYEWTSRNQQALVWYKRLFEINNTIPIAEKIGLISEQTGNYEDALRYYLFSGNNDTSYSRMEKLVELSMLCRKYKTGFATIRSYLERNPEHIQALNMLGILEINNKELTNALRTYNKIRSLLPDSLHWYYMCGQLYEWSDSLDQAIELYTIYVNKSIPSFTRDSLCSRIIEYYFWKNQYSLTIEFAKKIQSIESTKLFVYYAESLYKLNQKNRARTLFASAYRQFMRSTSFTAKTSDPLSELDKELFVLTCIRLDYKTEVVKQLKSLTMTSLWVTYYLPEIMQWLLNQREYETVASLFRQCKSQKNPITSQIKHLIDQEINQLTLQGRWDMALSLNQYMGY